MIIVNLGFFWDRDVRFHARKYKGEHQATCADATLTYGGLYFLAIAVMLTINKWIYFNMRLLVNIKMEQHDERRRSGTDLAGDSESTAEKRNRSSSLLILKAEEARKVDLKYFAVNILTAAIIIGYTSYVFFFFFMACFSSFK